MKGCGGYELLRTATSSIIELELIRPGSNGYTSEYLSNSYLGQATCFIRPIQIDLDISPVGEEHVRKWYSKHKFKELWIWLTWVEFLIVYFIA